VVLLLQCHGLAAVWHNSREHAAPQSCCTDHVCCCTGNPQAAQRCCCRSAAPPGPSTGADATGGHCFLRSAPCGDDDPASLASPEKLKYLPFAFPVRRACAATNAFHPVYAMACPSRTVEPQVPPPRPPAA
jgi:hypothetical protein